MHSFSIGEDDIDRPRSPNTTPEPTTFFFFERVCVLALPLSNNLGWNKEKEEEEDHKKNNRQKKLYNYNCFYNLLPIPHCYYS